jgi:ribonucleoside-diphosphate reductase alpha chain
MAELMKSVDSSISVTYLLPENTKIKDVYDFILKAREKEVKSIAAFPDKKMYGIVSFIPFKELAFKLKAEGVTIHNQNFDENELKELNIQKEDVILNTSNAPKRPKELEAEIFMMKSKEQKYIVIVGLLNGTPYEIFGGHANGFNIKNNAKGIIRKEKKGHYTLIVDSCEFDNISEHFTPVEQTIFRMGSTLLRHGVPIEFIVDQMQKSTTDMFSLPSALARVLKKYIKDGQKVHGQTCPSCKSTDLIYEAGCVTCSNCGWSKCS